jgi:hypothetical protein
VLQNKEGFFRKVLKVNSRKMAKLLVNKLEVKSTTERGESFVRKWDKLR